MIAYHVDNGADMTVGCVEVPSTKAREFGVMSVDARCASPLRGEAARPVPMPGRTDARSPPWASTFQRASS